MHGSVDVHTHSAAASNIPTELSLSSLCLPPGPSDTINAIMSKDEFDPAEVYPIRFPTFTIQDDGDVDTEASSKLAVGTPLQQARLPDATELLTFEIAGSKHALLTMDMNYHHVAQGRIRGVPFLVTFCCLCHTGVLMSPRVHMPAGRDLPDAGSPGYGRDLTFQCEGSHHGTFVMRDAETGTLWHHLTGKALHGPLAGTQLGVAGMHVEPESPASGTAAVPAAPGPPLQVTTVGAAMHESPGLLVHRSGRGGLLARALSLFSGAFHTTNMLPWPFSRMPAPDARLSRVQRGLGVVIAGQARFYRLEALQEALQTASDGGDDSSKGSGSSLTDTLAGRELVIRVGARDGVPFAVDSRGSRPLQVFSRWYGCARSPRLQHLAAKWRPGVSRPRDARHCAVISTRQGGGLCEVEWIWIYFVVSSGRLPHQRDASMRGIASVCVPPAMACRPWQPPPSMHTRAAIVTGVRLGGLLYVIQCPYNACQWQLQL